MKIKGIKKRLKALKPKETPRDIPQWCYEYASTLTPDRWILIRDALSQFKQGKENPEGISGDDRTFYERVIEASREGIIEL